MQAVKKVATSFGITFAAIIGAYGVFVVGQTVEKYNRMGVAMFKIEGE